MELLTRIVITTAALLLVAEVYPGITIVNLTSAVLAAIVLGVLNALVRPLLIILTIPITILTLGLFIIVINAALFALAAVVVSGFEVKSFFAAIVGSVLVSIISIIGNRFVRASQAR